MTGLAGCRSAGLALLLSGWWLDGGQLARLAGKLDGRLVTSCNAWWLAGRLLAAGLAGLISAKADLPLCW